MKLRVADYIAETLAEHGISDVFLVTGGGAMHLNDAFGRCKKLRYVCCHHEQACAIAAEAYARVAGRPAAVNVTSGPGGINALNGVFCAWVDSIPMVVVSGQVRRSTTLQRYGLIGRLRQLGDQEADILSMVRGITKYAVMIEDPQSVRHHLERAIHLAVAGRPGPCWIDVPVDVQGTMIDPETLQGYDPAEDAMHWETPDLSAACDAMLAKLIEAKRPVIYAGSGIRLSGAYDSFLKAIELLGIPVATAWNSNDLLWDEHPLYVGRPGSLGDRAGNFAVQNADVLLTLGCRLNIRQVTPNWENFARAAYRIMVDVDAEEMRKPSCKVHMPIHADVSDVFRLVIEKLQKTPLPPRDEWIGWCKERQAKYPVVLPEYWNTKQVNPYCFMKTFFDQLGENAIVVSGNGTACVTAFQAARIRRGQRLFHNSGCATMGYDLPGAIGAAIAKPGSDIFCITGDGSIMMNLQELQTIVGKRLPVKIFLLNNTGYHSVRQTQANFFPDNPVGCGAESGVTFPDFSKLAAAFGFPYVRCHNHGELQDSISKTAAVSGPAMCEVMLDLSQSFAPKASAKRLADGRIISVPLEDMSPFLNRDELTANMLIPV
jgi:acetolactate synthase I/II/III large subunit